MMYDSHIHIFDIETKVKAPDELRKSGVDGGILISLPPPSFGDTFDTGDYKTRIDQVLTVSDNHCIKPFFWIDPLEPDAEDQIDYSLSCGITGIKISCDHFYPSDDRCLSICRKMAEYRRPVLFHSGVLFDSRDSSKYNKPFEFEKLMLIPHFRFCLAHMCWPWIDDAIALAGKFLNLTTLNPHIMSEMFFDISPGCPDYYRKELLSKCFGVYDKLENCIMFGSDLSISGYSKTWMESYLGKDEMICQDLKISDQTKEKIFVKNYQKFIQ